MIPVTNQSRAFKLNEIKQLEKKIQKKRKQMNEEEAKFRRAERMREQKQEIHEYEMQDLIEDQQILLKEANQAFEHYNIFMNYSENDLKKVKDNKQVVATKNQNFSMYHNKRIKPLEVQQKQQKEHKNGKKKRKSNENEIYVLIIENEDLQQQLPKIKQSKVVFQKAEIQLDFSQQRSNLITSENNKVRNGSVMEQQDKIKGNEQKERKFEVDDIQRQQEDQQLIQYLNIDQDKSDSLNHQHDGSQQNEVQQQVDEIFGVQVVQQQSQDKQEFIRDERLIKKKQQIIIISDQQHIDEIPPIRSQVQQQHSLQSVQTERQQQQLQQVIVKDKIQQPRYYNFHQQGMHLDNLNINKRLQLRNQQIIQKHQQILQKQQEIINQNQQRSINLFEDFISVPVRLKEPEYYVSKFFQFGQQDRYRQKKQKRVTQNNEQNQSNSTFILDHNNIQLNMQQFVKYDWRKVKLLMMKDCKLRTQDWKIFCQNHHLFQQLSLLSIKSNSIGQVRKEDLQKFPKLNYVDFGRKFSQANFLDSQSIKELLLYQTENQGKIKISFYH